MHISKRFVDRIDHRVIIEGQIMFLRDTYMIQLNKI